MNLKQALMAAHDAGTTFAYIAKNIGKDPSTINKWLKGTSKFLSLDTEQDIIYELRRIKKCWENIDI